MDYNKKVWPKSYVPAPRIPKWFARDLAHWGGYNQFAQPNYRVVWGMDEREFLNGDPQAMKYPNPNDDSLGFACFILERYATPDFYNEEEWNRYRYGADTAGTDHKIDYLGPFPRRGRYINVAILMTEDFEPLELSSQLLDELKQRAWAGSQNMSSLARVELIARQKKARNKLVVSQQLQERLEYFRQRAEQIDATASRTYVGLLKSADPVAVRRTASLLSQ